MMQETLEEICRNNLLTNVLIKMSLIKSKSLRDLLKEGEQSEDIFQCLEEQRSGRRGTTNKALSQSSHSKGKDTIAVEIRLEAKGRASQE